MSAWNETEAVFDAAIRKLHEYGEAALATRLNQVAMGQTMKVEKLTRVNDQLGEHGRLMYAELVPLRRAPVGTVTCSDAKGSWLVLHNDSAFSAGTRVRLVAEQAPPK